MVGTFKATFVVFYVLLDRRPQCTPCGDQRGAGIKELLGAGVSAGFVRWYSVVFRCRALGGSVVRCSMACLSACEVTCWGTRVQFQTGVGAMAAVHWGYFLVGRPVRVRETGGSRPFGIPGFEDDRGRACATSLRLR